MIFDITIRIALIYLLIINLSAFIMYYSDKTRAIKHRWRIPESTLLGIAALGGSLGAFAAMKIFRHKTKHPKFYITVPLLVIIHIAVIIFVFLKLR
ncbi:MAG: DUF1294 domain-containing protein [Oscillospiraceae bacterium]|nr:DUF1294 domain-containing protein [Oscillospiraceae bacterium]